MTATPVPVGQDTWLLTQLEQAPPLGGLFLNSAVIRAAEPVLVDTGTAGNRASWLEQLGAVLDPADVRWIFISHDDPDHVGNLPLLLELCPRAVVLTSWFAVGRLAVEQGIVLPLDRIRLVNHGDTVDVGDRVLRAVAPPVFDNPTTCGLFDPVTGFYWGGDAFASLVDDFVVEAADVPGADWAESFRTLHRMLSPWHTLLDPPRFAAVVGQVQELPITVAAGAHGPVVRGERLDEAFRILTSMPHLEALPSFTQTDLESWLAATAAAPASARETSPVPAR